MTPELFGALLGIAALALVISVVAAVKWIVRKVRTWEGAKTADGGTGCAPGESTKTRQHAG